jgi:cbb3-type cytochrome oxidase subunit 3
MLVLFLGICGWAWSSKRRSVFDAASRLPLEDDETSTKKPDARHDDETER